MAPSAAARKAGGSLQRGCWYYRWAEETDSTEEGFREELTLKLDLEALTILRKNILETEKSPVTERHQCVNQVRYPTADGVAVWPVGPTAPQIAFRMEFQVLLVGGTES